MRNFFFGICALALIGFITYAGIISLKSSPRKVPGYTAKIVSPTVTIAPTSLNVSVIKKMLFVPYWTIGSGKIDITDYDQLVYFGITANANGIDTGENGYKNMQSFINAIDNKKITLLGVRLLNADINTKILSDSALQDIIISQSITEAKKNNFNGIVLDFEISAIGFDELTAKISNFEKKYAQQVKQNNLHFYATAYGDTFNRLRPFDMKTIGDASDGIIIMAYDFHKANGNAGPNFPLHATADDGYDLTTMIEDFSQKIPFQKIIVTFGMYGYDWQIDDQKRSTGQAAALSTSKIHQKFLNKCLFINCKILPDTLSTETEITYTDTNNHNHIVWFEDLNSVEKKITFLKTKNIASFGYWAYSYF